MRFYVISLLAVALLFGNSTSSNPKKIPQNCQFSKYKAKTCQLNFLKPTFQIAKIFIFQISAPISARRMRRQAEPETTTESGSETTTDLNSSGTEASGEESGVETSGAETSGAEGSGLESSGVDASGNEASGDVSGEEPIESGQIVEDSKLWNRQEKIQILGQIFKEDRIFLNSRKKKSKF